MALRWGDKCDEWRAKKGLKKAWIEVCNRHGVTPCEDEAIKLLNMAKNLLSRYKYPDPSTTAYDVMQETLQKLLRAPNYDNARPLYFYASKTVINAVNGYQRKLIIKDGQACSLDDPDISSLPIFNSATGGQEEYVLAKETLSYLNPSERELVFLLADFGYSEIAEKLGISEEAMRQRVHRLREKIDGYQSESAA